MQQSAIRALSATSSAMSTTMSTSKDSMAEGISSCDILNRLTKTTRDHYGSPVVVSVFLPHIYGGAIGELEFIL